MDTGITMSSPRYYGTVARGLLEMAVGITLLAWGLSDAVRLLGL